jgi:hypothetical protein
MPKPSISPKKQYRTLSGLRVRLFEPIYGLEGHYQCVFGEYLDPINGWSRLGWDVVDGHYSHAKYSQYGLLECGKHDEVVNV